MNRRESLVFLVVAFAGIRVLPAQQRIRRIGFIAAGTPPSVATIQAVMAGGRELGWIEGVNFTVERHWGAREALDGYAADLVRNRVELIVAGSAAAALAAKRATPRIPIVMASEVDPVAVGLVASLSRPGGNVTGIAELGDVTVAKRVELLRDLLPNARRVAVVVNTRASENAANRVNEAMYAKFGMTAVAFPVSDPRALFDTVNEAARQGMQALVLAAPNMPVEDVVERLMLTAIERKLPVIAEDAYVVGEGALASLGNDWRERDRTLWYFIDKILRGARPADLPVQQPSRFVTALNIATAKALGVTIAPQVLQRADRVFD